MSLRPIGFHFTTCITSEFSIVNSLDWILKKIKFNFIYIFFVHFYFRNNGVSRGQLSIFWSPRCLGNLCIIVGNSCYGYTRTTHVVAVIWLALNDYAYLLIYIFLLITHDLKMYSENSNELWKHIKMDHLSILRIKNAFIQ
jgi:hypothetical protein